ncbi:hypothetical protein T09_9725 [Trichinella sp. T9]|nr:hypothetical protein T09_9725 [Trichinella sp. T9]
MLLFWTKLFNARCLNVPILARIYLALGVIFQSFKLSSPFVDWFDARNKFLRPERIRGCFKWLTARLRTYPKAPKLNLHTYRAHVSFHSGRVSTAMIREC